MSLTIGSLCTGAGGLDMAAQAVLGGRHAWLSELDTDASTVLAARFPDVPNLGDLTAVDWRDVEPVDVLAAGYPCQPYSNAGQRKGHDDARAIWPSVAHAIGALRPRLVLLENVAAHAQRGFPEVVGDLAAIGYDATWTTLRASDVGAPHQRERLFVVATPTDPDREPLRLEPVAVGAREPAPVVGGDRPGPLMPTPTANLGRGAGLPTEPAAARYMTGRRMLDDAVALLPTPRASEGAKGGPNQRGSSGDLTLTSSVMLLPTPRATDGLGGKRIRPETVNDRGRVVRATGVSHGLSLGESVHLGGWAQYGPAIDRWATILGRAAPDPTVAGKRGGRRLSARFVEWLMGLPDGWVTDLVDNTPALRILGNGVVPQQGAAAFRALLGVAS